MTKKMRKAHSAVSIPIEGAGSNVSSTVFPHRSHVMTSVAESPATGKNIPKPSRPMVVVAKRAAPLNPVQQSQYKKLRFVPPEYQAELRNWVKDSSPMYRTPLRGTIAPLQQQSGTFNTSSAIGRTPPVDMMHRESAYSKAQSAQGATKMARKKKMEEGAGYAPSGASAEEILFGSLGGAPVKKRSMAPPKPPTPPKMPPPFPPGGGSGKRPPAPKPYDPSRGRGTVPPKPYNPNPTAKPTMDMGKMAKANRLAPGEGERLSTVGAAPIGWFSPGGRGVGGSGGFGRGKPPRISNPPYKPAPDMSTMPVDRPKPTNPGMGKSPVKTSPDRTPQMTGTPRPTSPGKGPGKAYPLPRNPGSPDGRYGSQPTPTEPPRSGAGGKYRDGGMGSVNKASKWEDDVARETSRRDAGGRRTMISERPDGGLNIVAAGGKYKSMLGAGGNRGGTRKMAKAEGQGAFINGKLAPQSHSLTKAATCPNCGGKMSKGMCKCMGKSMYKNSPVPTGTPSMTGGRRPGGNTPQPTYSPQPTSPDRTPRPTNPGKGPGNGGVFSPMPTSPVRTRPGRTQREMLRPNNGMGKMAKGARMCKCGSGMSKSMCKCGM